LATIHEMFYVHLQILYAFSGMLDVNKGKFQNPRPRTNIPVHFTTLVAASSGNQLPVTVEASLNCRTR